MIALSAFGGFVAFTASMTLLISTPFRLSALGFTAAEIGAAIAPWPLTNMVVAPLAGFLSDRIPAGLLGGIGMAVSITALLLLASCPPIRPGSTSPGGWRCAARGSALFLPPNARLIVGSAPRERAAAAGGLVSTVRLTGQTTGATLVAALLALGVGAGRTPPLVAAGLALVAGLCSLARLRPSIRNPARPESPRDVRPRVRCADAAEPQDRRDAARAVRGRRIHTRRSSHALHQDARRHRPLRQGLGQGRPVVLIHGWPLSRRQLGRAGDGARRGGLPRDRL